MPLKIGRKASKLKPQNLAKVSGNGVAKGVSGAGAGLKAGVAGVNNLVPKHEPKPEVQEKEPVAETASVETHVDSAVLFGTGDECAFGWENIGNYDSDPVAEDSEAILAKSQAMQTFLSDTYFSDYYNNTVLVVGTCFFAWVVGRLYLSVLWLGVVFFCAASAYRKEFRRFIRDVKDDMLRLSVSDRLEQSSESMQWLNGMLSKLWVAYMPLMGQMALQNVNPVLEDVAPGGGIEKIELAHFHLGSVAPRVTQIDSYTKLGPNLYEMDWHFAFDPNNHEDMTKAEMRSQVMPKVIIKTTFGKSFVSAKIPVNVENMGFVGKLKVRFTFCHEFPMIEIVRVQFLEPPKIDYALKPLTGAKLPGIDIMKLIPGLKVTINSVITHFMKSMLIAPNYQEVNLVEMLETMEGHATSAASVELEALYLGDSKGSKGSKGSKAGGQGQGQKSVRGAAITCYPDVAPLPESAPATRVSYTLLTAISGELVIRVTHNDRILGTARFDMTKFYQDTQYAHQRLPVVSAGQEVGQVVCRICHYPEQTPDTAADASTASATASAPAPAKPSCGILRVELNEAKGLDLSSSVSGTLSAHAEVHIDGRLEHFTRVIPNANEPLFNDVFESLVRTSKDVHVGVVVKNDTHEVGRVSMPLSAWLAKKRAANNKAVSLAMEPRGVVTAHVWWRRVDVAEAEAGSNPVAATVPFIPSLAAAAMHESQVAGDKLQRPETVGAAAGVLRVSIVSAAAPAARSLRIAVACDEQPKFVTMEKSAGAGAAGAGHEECVFDETTFVPLVSGNETVTLTLLAQGKPVGTVPIAAASLLRKTSHGTFFAVSKPHTTVQLGVGAGHVVGSGNLGHITYGLQFVPCTSESPDEVQAKVPESGVLGVSAVAGTRASASASASSSSSSSSSASESESALNEAGPGVEVFVDEQLAVAGDVAQHVYVRNLEESVMVVRVHKSQQRLRTADLVGSKGKNRVDVGGELVEVGVTFEPTAKIQGLT